MKDKIKTYIQNFLNPDHPQLLKIYQEEKNRRDVQPSVGLEVGKLLGLFVRMMDAKKIIEFGSCMGYSTIVLAQALEETGGKLISVEYRKDLYEKTKHNLKEANLLDVVELIHGDAYDVIQKVEGPFDMILQDSDKSLYSKMYEACINLTRKGGLIIADDTLFKPMGIPDDFSKPVHEYNQLVFQDERLYSTLLPIGDGLLVSTKL